MSQVIDVEATADERPSVAGLVPVDQHRESALVRPAADLATIEKSFKAYQELCDRLLVPSDYQRVGKKDFRKKSGWRKLAVAFGVSVELLDRQYERDDKGRIIRAECVTRATAPNGRTMDGLGACDVTERCCPSAWDEFCPSESYKNHTCCAAGCSGFGHFSKPSHDIPATAMTRSTNRACSDLFGSGEVSAEEMSPRDVEHDDTPRLEPANIEGWQWAAEMAGAHSLASAMRKMLPEGIDLTMLRAHAEEHGWPMPRQRLTEFVGMILTLAVTHAGTHTEAQGAPAAAGGTGNAREAQTAPESASEGQSGAAGDDEERCKACGEPILLDQEEPNPARRAVFNPEGDAYHYECAPDPDEPNDGSGPEDGALFPPGSEPF